MSVEKINYSVEILVSGDKEVTCTVLTMDQAGQVAAYQSRGIYENINQILFGSLALDTASHGYKLPKAKAERIFPECSVNYRL